SCSRTQTPQKAPTRNGGAFVHLGLGCRRPRDPQQPRKVALAIQGERAQDFGIPARGLAMMRVQAAYQ
ncbi:hypothetical protein, partial [Brevundimonas staleyi]